MPARQSQRNASRRRSKSARNGQGQGHSDGARSSGWLYGFHPVREALRARRRTLGRLWLRAGAPREDHAELADLARQAGVLVEVVDREDIDALAGGDAQTQGVALEAGPIPELTIEALVARAHETGGSRVLLALDGVEDPQNVGAVARVAESAGAAGLILTDRRAPELTPAVARASAGAIEWLPVARVPNLVRALGGLQREGYWVVAASAEEGQALFEMEDRLLSGPVVLVLGAEGKGIRPGVLKAADHRVWIPMLGEVASLNVSTAGAVLLYDLLRRNQRVNPA